MDRQENPGLQLDFPAIAAHKIVGDYRFSVNETRKFCPAYDWDKPRNDPNQELIEAKRELSITLQQLQEKRNNFRNIRAKLDEQWYDLEDNQSNLKDDFVKFNKFFKINEEKRNRAKTRLADAKQHISEIDAKTNELRAKYEHLQHVKVQMDQNIEDNRIYVAYLDQVLPLMPDIQNFHQMILRYEALLEARQYLVVRQQKNLKAYEDIKKDVLRIIEENNTKIVGLATQLELSHSRYEYARQQTLNWERMLDRIKNHIFRNYCIKDQAEKSINNLYLLMCTRKQVTPKFVYGQFDKQLEFIKRTLVETRRIHEILVEINRKKRPTTTATS